jgi:triacylglycerol lipase
MARSPSYASEAFAGVELTRLLADPVFYGVGVPRGDGRLVSVLPGLFGNDWYLYPLRDWLRRIGYRPVLSTLRVNAGCPERLSRRVEEELEMKRERYSGPVALIGHSRGGILARAIAARLQEDASHLILLGSPVGAITSSQHWPSIIADATANPVAESSARARRQLDPDCDVPHCGCPFPNDLRRDLHPETTVVSIFSNRDPIVPAQASVVPDARNIEVSGTHSGLAYNRAVYKALADSLRN